MKNDQSDNGQSNHNKLEVNGKPLPGAHEQTDGQA